MTPISATTPATAVADPYRYGWRYVRKVLPDGRVDFDQVPLTLEDTLHPEEGDFIVDNMAHHENADYLFDVLRGHFADRPDVVVVGDCRVDWGSTEIRPHGPDLGVFEGVGEHDRTAGTFRVAELGARPLLVIEVTSPDRLDNDLITKVDHYYRVGVPFYAVVDGRVRDGERTIELIGYVPGRKAYERVPLDKRGRLWLETVRLWLAAEGGRVVCYDISGRHFPSYVDMMTEKREEERHERAKKARADAERERANAEKARAEVEKARADAEAQARQAAEAQLRELEAEMRRLRGEG